jgi:hypothetical protein
MRSPHSLATTRFTDPTKRLVLRWGSYRGRYALGLAGVIAGIIFIQFTNTYSLGNLGTGSVLEAFGWFVLPAAEWRRIVVVAPCIGVSWLMLAGATFAGFATLGAAAWLVVRHRPPASYLALVLPLVNGSIVGSVLQGHEHQLSYALTTGAVVTATAWSAYALARAS